MNLRIEGTVATGFESIRRLYERNMHTLAEENTQLCIYVGEECVVDLWATAIGDSSFNGDSLVNVFSSGKSLESILLAMLCDRGLLNYDDKIVEYWPEFGKNNKTEVTVADLMRHEAGLAAFDTSLDPNALLAEKLRANSVAPTIEKQKQNFRVGLGKEREYHAVTRGWIANELFRRVETNGRTMGQFLREEISEPLNLDVYIGLRDAELGRVSQVKVLGIFFQLAQGFIPKIFGRKIELNIGQMCTRLIQLAMAMRDRTNKGAPRPLTGSVTLSLFDSPTFCKGETPSAGAKCSARGLAKLAAALANGGVLQKHRVLSEAAHTELHAKPIKRDMTFMNTTFSQGGVALFPQSDSKDSQWDTQLNCGREGYAGWLGLGGSIFQWHLEHKIGFAYVPTSLHVLDLVNERGKAYQAEAIKCVKNSKG